MTDASPLRVLVTGASRGIGFALTQQYLARGDEVFASVRDAHAAPALTTLASPRLHVLALDVSSWASVRAARSQVATLDRLDVVINNAGINGGPQRAPGMDLAQLERVLSVNAIGPVRVYDAFVDLLRRSTRGRMVNVGSEAGSLGAFRASSKPDYAMSKAALNAFTRWAAAQEDNVVCVCIDPGWTRTGMGGKAAPNTPEQTAAKLVDAIDRLERRHHGTFLSASLEPMAW